MTSASDLAAFETVLQQMDEAIHILMLVKGRWPDGTDHHAYVSIPPSRYQAFKEAEAKGAYDLAAFGTILLHGEGLQPSRAVKEQMEKQYGIDHHFEEELLQIAERLQKAIFSDNNT